MARITFSFKKKELERILQDVVNNTITTPVKFTGMEFFGSGSQLTVVIEAVEQG